ncbi:MAG: hypothetical protein ACR2Q3_14295 [Woeseiaceae bacterium]
MNSKTMFLLTLIFLGTSANAQSLESMSLTLRLQDAASPGASPTEFSETYAQAEISVRDIKVTAGAVRPLRHIEYSADQIVIVGLAANGLEKSRVVMTDPRLIRAEFHNSDDQWETAVLYRKTVDFSVSLPADPTIVQLSVLKPRWTGSEWLFDVLAGVAIK